MLHVSSQPLPEGGAVKLFSAARHASSSLLILQQWTGAMFTSPADTSDQMDHSQFEIKVSQPQSMNHHQVPPNRMTMMRQLSQQVASVPIQSP